MSLLPLPPADQQSAPHSFSVPLANALQVTLPDDDFSIRGTLLPAIGSLSSIFVARAFQAGTQVSNAAPTQQGTTQTQNGMFQLVVPSAAAAAGVPVTLQLTSQSQADPWFISKPITLPTAPPVPALSITLPAYSTLNQFSLTVSSADDPTVKVSGAIVRAQTTVGTNDVGTTQFARSGTTDGNGTASLSLLPGSANTPLPYTITVTSPVNSPYASLCLDPIGVKSGGTVNSASASSLTPTPVLLATRAVLTGTVYDSHGYAVPNVSVTATPRPLAAACNAPAATPSSTTTDAGGFFSLPLDPGTYQLDYDPPSGSSAPRFTDPVDFVLATSDTGHILHNVPLPAGGLVQGVAYSRRVATADVGDHPHLRAPLHRCGLHHPAVAAGADGDRRKRPVPDRGSSSPVSDPGRAEFAPI